MKSSMLDVDDDEIMIGDIHGAFNQADPYASNVGRYAVWQQYKGAPLRVFYMAKPLYGTDDAAMAFHVTFVKWIISPAVGYVQSENDKAVYTHPATKHRVEKHVDDLKCRGRVADNAKFRQMCTGRFPIKGWHILTITNPVRYNGVDYLKKIEGGQAYYGLTQKNDIRDFLDEHGYKIVRPVSSPMGNIKDLIADTRGVTPTEHAWIRSTLGMLSYFADKTVFDMAAEVNMISQYAANPNQSTLKAIKRVMAWLAQDGV